MKKSINEKEIVLTVYKNLTRVLKNKKLYHIFRCAMGNGEGNLTIRYSSFYPFYYCDMNSAMAEPPGYTFFRERTSENPFNKCRSVNDVLDKLLAMCEYELDSSDDKKTQMRILHHINNLIHYCIENNVRDFRMLESIGKETFDMTCKNLFGDKFVDKTEEEIPEDARRIMEAQREFLTSDEGRGFRPQELGSNKKFLEFLKRKKLLNLSKPKMPSMEDIAKSHRLVMPRDWDLELNYVQLPQSPYSNILDDGYDYDFDSPF